MKGFLIKIADPVKWGGEEYKGPHEKLLYKSENTAQKALDGWPGLKGEVVPVKIIIFKEQKID